MNNIELQIKSKSLDDTYGILMCFLNGDDKVLINSIINMLDVNL